MAVRSPRRVFVVIVFLAATVGAFAGSELGPVAGAAPGRGELGPEPAGRVRHADLPQRDVTARGGASADTGLDGLTPSGHRAVKAAAETNGRAQRGQVEDRAGTEAPATTTSFAGINRPGGGSVDPPDTIVGASPNRVLEAVNSSLRLTTHAGAQLASSGLGTFFSTSSSLVFDPKVVYDTLGANDRFYVVALQVTGRGNTSTADNVSTIRLAVSRSSNPANLSSSNWCRYTINGIRNAGTAQESWADFPQVGFGVDKFAIATNQFRFSNDAFTFNVIRIMNKTIMSNNAASCPSFTFSAFQPTATEGNFDFFTIQPAQFLAAPSSFTGTTNPLYFMSTRRGSGSFYKIFRVRTTSSGALSLGSTQVTGNFTYDFPPDAPGGGSINGVARRIDTGDTRIEQVAGFGNSMVGVHSTVCNFGGGASESCSRDLRVSLSQNSSTQLVTASIVHQQTFGCTNCFYHHPGTTSNNSFEFGMVFQSHRSTTGTPNALSGRWVVRASGAQFTTSFPLNTGTCRLATGFDADRNAFRSGDYVGAQRDTGGNTMWFATERAETLNGVCQWGTRVVEVDPSV